MSDEVLRMSSSSRCYPKLLGDWWERDSWLEPEDISSEPLLKRVGRAGPRERGAL